MAGENLNLDPDEKKGEGEPKMVPLEALEAERRKRQDSDAKAAQFEGQVQGLTAARPEPKVDPPKEWSAAELRQGVEEGKLTEDEAVAISTRQIEKRITSKVTEEVETTLARKNLGERVSAEIGRYKQAIPDLLDQNSAAFRKIQTEFTYLTGQGYDAKDPRTELIAVRGAFGDIGQLEKIGKPGERENHQEVGGNAEPGPAGGSDQIKDMPPKGLSQDAKKHYGAQIERGMYPDWAAVSKELEGASPSVKARLGI